MAPRRILLPLSATVVIMAALLCCEKPTEKPASEIDPFAFKSATELTLAIQRGEITSTDLLNRYLDRIERYDSDINAVVALNINAARARAAEADKALAQGKNWGPLHGLPMTIKDLFEVAGMPTVAGDPELKGHVPITNAIAVQRLVDAGAIISPHLELFRGMGIYRRCPARFPST